MGHWLRPACRWRDQEYRLRPALPPARILVWGLLGSIPFERAFLPFVGKADGEDGEENNHRPEAGCAEPPERHCPREQECHFQIKDNKEDRHQVEPDVEFHAGIVKWIESALIGRQLF